MTYNTNSEEQHSPSQNHMSYHHTAGSSRAIVATHEYLVSLFCLVHQSDLIVAIL